MSINYTEFDRPYDNELNRASDDSSGLSSSDNMIEGPDTASGSSTGGYGGDYGTPVTGNGKNPNALPPGGLGSGDFSDIFIENWIKSRNYYPKKGGFYIDGKTGYAEFSNVYVSGTIIATVGEIGGWVIGDTFIRAGGTSSATADMLLDSLNKLIRVGAASSENIIIDGLNQRIRSSNYMAGQSGFTVEPELIEATNIKARGKLQTVTFEKETISAVGGSIQVNKGSQILDVDMTALDSSTLTTDGSFTLAVGDILRIKDGQEDEWLEVTNIASAPTYSVDRDKAGVYPPNANPIWTKGVTVVNYGVSGDGLVEMITGISDSPYMKIATHTGAPWSSMDTKVVVGNIAGKTGNPNEYGIWVKGESIYAAGVKQYDAIATKEGTGGSTAVYYNGVEYSSIKATIQAAETAGESSISIFVRVGTYDEDGNASNYTIGTDGFDIAVTLVGEDINNTFINFSNNASFTLRGWLFDGYDVSLTNISFIKDGSNQPWPALVFNNCQVINIDNISVTNTGTGVTSGCGCLAIQYTTPSDTSKPTIINSFFESQNTSTTTNFTTIGSAVYLVKAQNAIVQNNIVFTDAVGVRIGASSGAGITQNIDISSNTIGILGTATANKGVGIYIADEYSKYISIDDNIIYRSNGTGDYSYGVYVDGSSSVTSVVHVDGNYILNCERGIYMEGASNSAINNLIDTPTTYGIVLRGAGSSADAPALKCDNNTILSAGTEGISFIYGNMSISSNILIDCLNGIGDSYSDSTKYNINIIGNIIRNFTEVGINIGGYSASFSSQNFIISENVLYGNDSSVSKGIRLWNGLDNAIFSSNIIDNVLYGFFFQPNYLANQTSTIIITDNLIDSSSHSFYGTDGTYFISLIAGSFSNNYMEGEILFGGSQDLNMSGNYFAGSFLTQNGNINTTQITNNFFDGTSAVGGFLFTGTEIANCLFSNNQFYGNGANAPAFSADGNVRNCTFSNNIFDSQSYHSFFVAGDIKDSTLTTNRFDNTTSSSITCVQIDGNWQRTDFSDNKLFKDNGAFGLNISGTVDNISTNNRYGSVFANNNMNTESTGGNQPMIRVEDDMYNAVVTGNRIYTGNNPTYAISILGDGIKCIFTSNRISNTVTTGDADGVNIAGASSGTIFGNNLKT